MLPTQTKLSKSLRCAFSAEWMMKASFPKYFGKSVDELLFYRGYLESNCGSLSMGEGRR